MDFVRGGEKVGTVHGRGDSYDIFGHPHGNMRCSCMAWKFSKKPAAERTCKHLERMKDALRVAGDGVESPFPDVEFVIA